MIPVADPASATPGLLLDHVPPPGVLLSVTKLPVHIDVGPAMAEGAGITVTVLLAKHPGLVT